MTLITNDGQLLITVTNSYGNELGLKRILFASVVKGVWNGYTLSTLGPNRRVALAAGGAVATSQRQRPGRGY